MSKPKYPDLIHYGATYFNRGLVKPIRNNIFKPNGGFWTSPIESNHSWKQWCDDQGFRECIESNSMKIRLEEDARVLIIDSASKLRSLPRVGTSPINSIDFKKLSKIYDAIWLTEIGERTTRFSSIVSLYGWDCESVLIMNPNCCYQFDE